MVLIVMKPRGHGLTHEGTILVIRAQRRGGWLALYGLWPHGTAYKQVNPAHMFAFIAPQCHQQFPIMGLNPGFQKAGRYGKSDETILLIFQFNTGKPTGEDIFPQFGPQSLFHTIPFFLAHFHVRLLSLGVSLWKSLMSRRTHLHINISLRGRLLNFHSYHLAQ